MRVHVRVREKDQLAKFLGWFSVGLGTAQVLAPKAMSKLVGAEPDGATPHTMRLMGGRELTQGTGILARPRPAVWLWSRVAGDAIDLALLSAIAARNRRARTLFAIGNVGVVTVADVKAATGMSRKPGGASSGMLVRKAVTIERPQADVEQAWAGSELSRLVGERGAAVVFGDAPGDRGTEVAIEFVDDPPAGDLGAVVQKATGKDLATQLADDLRRFKQVLETGEVVRSESTPDGHLLAEHLKQRPAQPLEEVAA